MADVPEPVSDLWDAVKNAGVAAFEYLWPPDSESAVYALADVFSGLAAGLRKAIEVSSVAARSMFDDSWRDSAGFHIYHNIDSFNKDGLDQVVTELEKLAAACRAYAKQISDAKMAIFTEIAINVGLFALASVFGGPAGAAMFAARVAGGIAAKMATFAGRAAQAVNGLGKFKQFGVRLAGEMVQEAAEEALIDLSAQSLSMLRGYGDINLRQTATAAASGAAGGLMGTAVNKLGGRWATDKLGVVASRHMPDKLATHVSRGTNSVVVNGVTSPAAGIIGHGVVNGEWQGMSVKEYLGNAAAAGTMAAARTNSQLAGNQLFEHRTGGQSPTWEDLGRPPDGPPPDGPPPMVGELPEKATASSGVDVGSGATSEALGSTSPGSASAADSGHGTDPAVGSVDRGSTSTAPSAVDRADSVAGTDRTTGAIGMSSPAMSAVGGATSSRAGVSPSQPAATGSTQTASASEKHTDDAPSRADTELDVDRDDVSATTEASTDASTESAPPAESVSPSENAAEHGVPDPDGGRAEPSEHHDPAGEPLLTGHPTQPAETGQHTGTSSPAGPGWTGTAGFQPLPISHVGQLAERAPPVQGVPRAVSASTVQPVPAVRGAVTGPSPVGV
ncbi:WXG100-like domain-containing protein, partial [Micromonospora sonneratiae]